MNVLIYLMCYTQHEKFHSPHNKKSIIRNLKKKEESKKRSIGYTTFLYFVFFFMVDVVV